MAEPMSPFLGLDAVDAVELGELLAFPSDWLASDPNRLEASLYDYVVQRPTTSAPCAASTNYAQTLSATLECCSAMTGRPGEEPLPPAHLS